MKRFCDCQMLMKKCSRLEEYAIFIQQIRLNLKKGMKPKKAMDEAIFYCIDHGIMADYLKKHRFRARGNGMLEYGSARHIYMERRDSRAAGRVEGILSSIEQMQVNTQMSLEDACHAVGWTVEQYESAKAEQNASL